jgi:16S rRNA (adenine(1408)-N(1))-methyltransferase
LAKYSRKTTLKPARGGVRNALFVCASCEALPEELNDLASEMTVLFPWGSLLKSVVRADNDFLRGIRRICREGAEIRIVFGYDQRSEPGVTAELALPALMPNYVDSLAGNHYRQAGFALNVRQLRKAEIGEIPTTWARKLAYGKDRVFFELCGKAM